MTPNKIGLVLTGGGARAAYQAGVLKGIAEILGEKNKASPFQLISGISAGGINAAVLGAGAEDFKKTTHELCDIWGNLEPDNVINTNFSAITKLSTRWIRDLSFGGAFGNSSSTFLMDVRSLRKLLSKVISFESLYRNLQSEVIEGFALSATNYKTGTAISFFDGKKSIEPWSRSSRIGMREKLTLDHVLASASIPILFPPVKLKNCYYGDGSVRLSSPLSPAIHMGADRLVAIGIRYHRSSEMTWDMNQSPSMEKITLAHIAGTMLNATFFDTLDSDIERMHRINHTISKMSEEQREQPGQKLRVIPLLVISPSQDLGSLVSTEFNRFPQVLRYFLAGIGASGEQGWDLLSYLAFDKSYTVPVIALGFKDALVNREAILDFFN